MGKGYFNSLPGQYSVECTCTPYVESVGGVRIAMWCALLLNESSPWVVNWRGWGRIWSTSKLHEMKVEERESKPIGTLFLLAETRVTQRAFQAACPFSLRLHFRQSSSRWQYDHDGMMNWWRTGKSGRNAFRRKMRTEASFPLHYYKKIYNGNGC